MRIEINFKLMYDFENDRLLCAECKAEIQNQEQEKEE